MSAPQCVLGRFMPDQPTDKETLKRQGWHEQRILVVSEQDGRLTWWEREFVRQIGEKLYGRQA